MSGCFIKNALTYDTVLRTALNSKTNFIDFTETVKFTIYMENGVITQVRRSLFE